jgi:hypothetical protein
MHRHYVIGVIVSILFTGATITPVHADAITTYGAGLKSCKTYLEARQSDTGEQAVFVHWLSGFFSGVNKTARHRNNFLGLEDLNHAMSWLDDYCSSRPAIRVSAAVGIMLLGAKTGPATHAVEAPSYGSADKSCESYVEARAQRDDLYSEESAEYTNWLGGYVSGVNAMSFGTNSVLGNAELSEAVSWLERYCGAHPENTFSTAVDALITSQQPRLASQPAASAPR